MNVGGKAMLFDLVYANGNVILSRLCQKTRQKHSVTMTEQQYANWINPANADRLIQDILPDLSIDDREFLISGISPEGWKLIFG